jgi:hypothetical protein|tara:strand:- start:40067 stop:40666 length:600 start_codon:yes stop_codon:yes gene_type:complete
MSFKKKDLIFSKEGIYLPNGEVVMSEWQGSIMKKSADFVCQNGGHILEIGFGIGVASQCIQNNNIESHTICEIHPQIQTRLKKWAWEKEEDIIILGDWFENLMTWKDNADQSRQFDGILYNGYQDTNHYMFRKLVELVANDNCKVTWWNNRPREWNEMKLPNVNFEQVPVNPPQNNYFNHKVYFMPKYTHKWQQEQHRN